MSTPNVGDPTQFTEWQYVGGMCVFPLDSEFCVQIHSLQCQETYLLPLLPLEGVMLEQGQVQQRLVEEKPLCGLERPALWCGCGINRTWQM